MKWSHKETFWYPMEVRNNNKKELNKDTQIKVVNLYACLYLSKLCSMLHTTIGKKNDLFMFSFYLKGFHFI